MLRRRRHHQPLGDDDDDVSALSFTSSSGAPVGREADFVGNKREKQQQKQQQEEEEQHDNDDGEDEGQRLRRRRSSSPGAENYSFLRTNAAAARRAAVTNELNNNSNNNNNADNATTSTATTSTYHIAKWLILRLLGFVYFIAFMGAYCQNDGLMGQYGLVPYHMDKGAYDAYDTPIDGFMKYPTIFWFVSLNDTSMKYTIWMGLIISFTTTFLGINSWFLQFALWILDFSIVTTANTFSPQNSFYSYGWESQLLETGFLSIFLCALPCIDFSRSSSYIPRLRLALWESNHDNNNNNNNNKPSAIILWLYRWLCFRISMGAGLIKIRGSSCWTTKTCLYYHFETQPIPSPLSFVYHFLPQSIHRRMVDTDLFVQVYASPFVLVPLEFMAWSSMLYFIGRNILRISGIIQAGFMVAIILSGNFAFLNHLTIIPALACFDDGFFSERVRRFVIGDGKTSSATTTTTTTTAATSSSSPPSRRRPHVVNPYRANSTSSTTAASSRLVTWLKPSRRWLDTILLVWISYLSWPVVANLLQLKKGSRQLMNASFDNFRIVNTYGAFGSVGQARYEAIVQTSNGTAVPTKPWGVGENENMEESEDWDTVVQRHRQNQNWTELEFPCKPGTVTRRPCFCAPYHYRVDWNIWFLGFKPHQGMLQRRERWLYAMLAKVLQPPRDDDEPRPWLALFDQSTAKYLSEEYYQHGQAPRMVKVDMYHYRMSKPLWIILWDYLVDREKEIVWWIREYEESLVPPVIWDNTTKKLRTAYSS